MTSQRADLRPLQGGGLPDEGAIIPPSVRQVTPPPGYHEVALMDPFEAFIGPFFERRAPDEGPGFDGKGVLWAAFYIDERHVNGVGIAHGGMLMSFADATLGTIAWNAGGRSPCVTLSMQTSFMKAGRIGDLVEVQPELIRQTRSVLFVRGTYMCKGEPLFSATSLWKTLGS